jgi:glyceraldehyde-3-phosphate dehydrogenase (NADP+)
MISAHKIAPAIGAGCPLVMKAPDRTPRIVLRLAALVLEAGWPAEGLSVLTGGPDIGQALVEDIRPRLVSFTGSSEVGKRIARRAGFKRLLLELGSNSATIVCESADVEHAANRIVAGAFAAAGQSCISVQRVYVHHSRRAELEKRVVALTGQVRLGTTDDRTADVGPVLTDQAAERIQAMIDESAAAGAKILIGGKRSGRFVEPTVISGVTEKMPLHTEEVFGPVVALATFSTIDEAIALVNDSRYGLQAGIFTDSAAEAQLAARRIEVGGVHINEISMWRADHMPYGGIKDSGFGKEGPASAMREMSVYKVVSWAQ